MARRRAREWGKLFGIFVLLPALGVAQVILNIGDRRHLWWSYVAFGVIYMLLPFAGLVAFRIFRAWW